MTNVALGVVHGLLFGVLAIGTRVVPVALVLSFNVLMTSLFNKVGVCISRVVRVECWC
jgi:hypothetical protein